MKSRVALTVIGTVLLFLAATGLAYGADRSGEWVLVTGPEDWPHGEYRLDIGPESWRMDEQSGGGLGSYNVTRRVHVTLVRMADCRTLMTFTAGPGTRWVIRFQADGSVRLEDHTKDGLDTGGALASAGHGRCLPATDAEDPGAPLTAPEESLALPFVLVAALVTAVGFARRRGPEAVVYRT